MRLYDTGMPESIVAAAFSRIGQSVLHLDKYVQSIFKFTNIFKYNM